MTRKVSVTKARIRWIVLVAKSNAALSENSPVNSANTLPTRGSSISASLACHTSQSRRTRIS